MKNLVLFLGILCLCCTEPNPTQVEDPQTNTRATGNKKFLENPQKTYIIIAGALEWKDALSPFDKKNRKDAELEQKFLSMGVPAANIRSMYDSKTTLANMNAAVDKMAAAADENSTIIFYYAGHGLNESAGVYFANYDINLKRPTETGFAINTLHEKLGKSKVGEIWLLADCCYSGGLLGVCEKLGKTGKQVVALTSSTSSNISTGNWTFTQTLLDCLDGRAWADHNTDGVIDLGEMKKEVRQAMKHRERQLNGFETKGVDESITMATAKPFNNDSPKVGEYAWGKYEKKWKPIRILDVEGNTYKCEFYFYSDKVAVSLTEADVRPMHFVRFKEGASVEVEWNGKWYKATVKKTSGDFCYITYNDYDDTWNEWVLYDRIRSGKEQKVEVKDGANYYPAFVLDEKDGKYFIHYLNYDNSWDEWVGSDRIKK